MIVNSRIKYCEIVPDDKPFVLFGIEVLTVYSATILPKRYEDFLGFHRRLCYFWNTSYKSGKLLELIPSLPFNSSKPLALKEAFSAYLRKIVELLQNSCFNRYHPWIKLINDFFTVEDIVAKEESMASAIQVKFKRFSYMKKSEGRKFFSLTQLPYAVVQRILSFLSPYDTFQAKSTSKLINKSINQLECIRSLSCLTYQNFSVLDLSDCDLVDRSLLYTISQWADCEVFRELVLDRCKFVNDYALARLMCRYESVDRAGKGGARNLVALSLSSCAVTHTGVKSLRKLNKLQNLNLSGCKITDSSIEILLIKLKNIRQLDVSNTNISDLALERIEKSEVKVLNVTKCDKLSYDKVQKLSTQKVISSSDVFLIEILSESNPSMRFNIKANKLMLVADIHSYLQNKLNTSDDFTLKSNGKPLKKYIPLQDLPQRNSNLLLTFETTAYDLGGLPIWQDKASAKSCTQCNSALKWYSRKINCRNCGKIICSRCIKSEVHIKSLGYTQNKVPICSTCYKIPNKFT